VPAARHAAWDMNPTGEIVGFYRSLPTFSMDSVLRKMTSTRPSIFPVRTRPAYAVINRAADICGQLHRRRWSEPGFVATR